MSKKRIKGHYTQWVYIHEAIEIERREQTLKKLEEYEKLKAEQKKKRNKSYVTNLCSYQQP